MIGNTFRRTFVQLARKQTHQVAATTSIAGAGSSTAAAAAATATTTTTTSRLAARRAFRLKVSAKLSKEAGAIMAEAEALHQRLAAAISPATCADIEGLDHAQHGFCRGACEAGIPEDERNSFSKLRLHLLLATTLRPTEWAPKCENVPELTALGEKFAGDKTAKLTAVAIDVGAAPFTVVIDTAAIATGGAPKMLEYAGGAAGADGAQAGELPWLKKGTIVADRSKDVFVLVCAHRERDARCGYCGAILVDLLKSAFEKKKLAGDALSGAPRGGTPRVYACSHVGGHAYAGNVLVYAPGGAFGFGCITPGDVDELVDFVASLSHQPVGPSAAIPEALVCKLRGRMGSM